MRLNFNTYLTHAGYLLALCALCPQVFAQDDAEVKWYQVEVAIFTQPENAQLAASQETFRKDISLSYGEHTQILQSAEEANRSNQAALMANDSSMDESGNTPTVALDAEQNPEGVGVEIPLTPELINEIIQHQAFVKLPVELRNLNETVGALERRNRQRILFHEAWRQPLIDPEQATAIIVSGGDSFDKERELAGTIKFGVSRYIHAHTNLWFSEFASNNSDSYSGNYPGNYGQSNQDWPMVPMPPNAKNGDIADTLINLNAGVDNSTRDLWQQYEVIDTTYQNIVEKPFTVTNLATLIQTRRMRSGEVHYIDHPKIGILITVTPFERKTTSN